MPHKRKCRQNETHTCDSRCFYHLLPLLLKPYESLLQDKAAEGRPRLLLNQLEESPLSRFERCRVAPLILSLLSVNDAVIALENRHRAERTPCLCQFRDYYAMLWCYLTGDQRDILRRTVAALPSEFSRVKSILTDMKNFGIPLLDGLVEDLCHYLEPRRDSVRQSNFGVSLHVVLYIPTGLFKTADKGNFNVSDRRQVKLEVRASPQAEEVLRKATRNNYSVNQMEIRTSWPDAPNDNEVPAAIGDCILNLLGVLPQEWQDVMAPRLGISLKNMLGKSADIQRMTLDFLLYLQANVGILTSIGQLYRRAFDEILTPPHLQDQSVLRNVSSKKRWQLYLQRWTYPAVRICFDSFLGYHSLPTDDIERINESLVRAAFIGLLKPLIDSQDMSRDQAKAILESQIRSVVKRHCKELVTEHEKWGLRYHPRDGDVLSIIEEGYESMRLATIVAEWEEKNRGARNEGTRHMSMEKMARDEGVPVQRLREMRRRLKRAREKPDPLLTFLQKIME